MQRFNVHIKNELGHDDNVVVRAGSEIEAIRAAVEQHDSVADVIDAYPADAETAGDEVTPEVWEQWEKAAVARDAGAKLLLTGGARQLPPVRPAAHDDLDAAVGRARKSLTQFTDPPSTSWGCGWSTSNDDDVRER